MASSLGKPLASGTTAPRSKRANLPVSPYVVGVRQMLAKGDARRIGALRLGDLGL